MRKVFNWDKKYFQWGFTAFCVIACSILFYMLLNYLPVIGSALKKLGRILSPFIWGLIFTYLLAPLFKFLYGKVFLPLTVTLSGKKKKGSPRAAKALSVFVSTVVFIAAIVALAFLIIPTLAQKLSELINNSGLYIDAVNVWVQNLLANNPELVEMFTGRLELINTNIFDWLRDNILPDLNAIGSLASNVTTGLYNFLRGVYNVVIGIIVSIYLLSNLENTKMRTKRLCYCVFGLEWAEKIRDAIRFIDRTFISFINGKLLDSAIVGLICYIFCAIARIPNALLVSVIVGVTNIIPFFGPLIGLVPSAFIILIDDPVKCLIFVIFVIILQQVDGNFIGPKILGGSTGINGFWVMFSIILGAGLFSFWGMLLGVPVFVVVYTGLGMLVERRLKKKALPVEAEEYRDIDHVDPITRQAVKAEPEPAAPSPREERKKKKDKNKKDPDK